MSRHPIERHNEDFKRLFEKVAASLGVRNHVATATAQAAEQLGVTVHTVTSWLRPEGGRSACACPKWRVDMFKLANDGIANLSEGQRDKLLAELKGLRSAGVMSEATAAAFDRLARRVRRAA